MKKINLLGRTIEFSEGRLRYNSLRLNFSQFAYGAVKEFREKFPEKKESTLDLGMEILKKTVHTKVEGFLLVLGAKEINALELVEKGAFVQAVNQGEESLDKLCAAIYLSIFNLHNDVQQYNEEQGNKYRFEPVSVAQVKQAQEILDNTRTHVAAENKLPDLLEQALTLNPYSREVYHQLVFHFGDEDKSVEHLAALFGYNIRPYKRMLLTEVAKTFNLSELSQYGELIAQEEMLKIKEVFNKHAEYLSYDTAGHPFFIMLEKLLKALEMKEKENEESA